MKQCAALMLLVMAWAAPVAHAAEITARDRSGDVAGGASLGQRQRAALDIQRVRATADAAGLAVDVRLGGDFERQAGSGVLRSAVGAITLTRARGRTGKLLTRGRDSRAQVRSEALAAGHVVVRNGRMLRFRVGGDVSTVTKLRVRVSAVRPGPRGRTASDTATVVLGVRPSAGSAPCGDYATRRSDLEALLGTAIQSLAHKQSASRRKRLTQERRRVEDFLFGLGRRILLTCPDLPPSAGPNGSHGPGVTNAVPVPSFTVSPPGPGFKAGQTLSFDAAASQDSDGTIASYVWSDGDPPHEIATGVRTTRRYLAPGIYTIRLGVTDNAGATAFAAKTLFFGGAGSKDLRNPDNSMVQVNCPSGGATTSGAVEIVIPSYAEDPTVSLPDPCPGATLGTTVTRLAGNPAGELDEWGRPRDRMRIAYTFTGSGGQTVALDWAATWT